MNDRTRAQLLRKKLEKIPSLDSRAAVSTDNTKYRYFGARKMRSRYFLVSNSTIWDLFAPALEVVRKGPIGEDNYPIDSIAIRKAILINCNGAQNVASLPDHILFRRGHYFV